MLFYIIHDLVVLLIDERRLATDDIEGAVVLHLTFINDSLDTVATAIGEHDDRRVVPMFAYQLLNDQPITVHGDGHQTRTFCYITDAMVGFLKVLLQGRDSEAYNIGNEDNEISMRDLAQVFVDTAGSNAKYELIPYPDTYPAGEPQRRCPDLTKARSELGYDPQVSFSAGIERFMNWCRTQESYVGTKAIQTKQTVA